jgi:hypothetical protein
MHVALLGRPLPPKWRQAHLHLVVAEGAANGVLDVADGAVHVAVRLRDATGVR